MVCDEVAPFVCEKRSAEIVASVSTTLLTRREPDALALVCPPLSLKITSLEGPGTEPPIHLLESDQLPAPSATAFVLPFHIGPTCSVNRMLFTAPPLPF